MASDKRPILSGKRARNRRKRAAQRAASKAIAEATPVLPPECDSDEDADAHKLRVRLELPDARADSVSSGKATASEDEDEDEDELVILCRPTTPDFCTTFVPRADETHARARGHGPADCTTFTVRVPAFRETREGFITYTLALATCAEPRQHFQVERRFSEFVACAAAVNPLLEAQRPAFRWELPAKTWLRVTQPSALEERRTQLERALETLLVQQDRHVCQLPVLRDFLMLDIFGLQVAEDKQRALD